MTIVLVSIVVALASYGLGRYHEAWRWRGLLLRSRNKLLDETRKQWADEPEGRY